MDRSTSVPRGKKRARAAIDHSKAPKEPKPALNVYVSHTEQVDLRSGRTTTPSMSPGNSARAVGLRPKHSDEAIARPVNEDSDPAVAKTIESWTKFCQQYMEEKANKACIEKDAAFVAPFCPEKTYAEIMDDRERRDEVIRLRGRQGEFCVSLGIKKVRAGFNQRDPIHDLTKWPLHVRDRFKWINRHENVQAWYGSGRSQILVINGNDESDGIRSPVTMWTASIEEFIFGQDHVRELGKNIFCFWYCYQATEMTCREMVLCLLAQFFEHSRVLHKVPDWKDENGQEIVYKFPALLKLFQDCVREQLKYTAVSIYLDNISLYDRGKTREAEMQIFFRVVAGIAQSNHNFPLHFAVTSATNTTKTAARVLDPIIVNVPNLGKFQKQQQEVQKSEDKPKY